jgi:3-oxoacyl-[acyl-carrier protein] reductase
MTEKARVAIVTGSAQGIGRDYAKALAADGAAVVCADIRLDGAKETAHEITSAGGQAMAIAVDVSKEDETKRLAAEVDKAFGRADILVNNAAIYHGIQMQPQMEVEIGYWRKVMAVNLDGALLMTQAIAPLMIRGGSGRIVNQTSIGAYSGYGGVYAVSKLALIGLTQGFARELGPHGITVNAIAPGPIYTDATLNVVPGQALDMLMANTPLKKKATPEDLIGTLRYFVSDAAAWVTGQTIIVDGGLTPRI